MKQLYLVSPTGRELFIFVSPGWGIECQVKQSPGVSLGGGGIMETAGIEPRIIHIYLNL